MSNSEGPSAPLVDIPLKNLHRVRIACWPVVSRVLQYPIFLFVALVLGRYRHLMRLWHFEVSRRYFYFSNRYVLGRYFSINSVNCSNENGFLNISLIPVFFICSKTGRSDEAVKMTIFFDSILPSCWSDLITSSPVNSGMAKSNIIRSNSSFLILSNPSLPSLITRQSISFANVQYSPIASVISSLSSISRSLKSKTTPTTCLFFLFVKIGF